METQAKKQTFEELMAQTDAVINEGVTFLEQNGRKVDLSHWITIAEYTKRFKLKSTMVVTNWIKRGVIPADHVITVPELNNIRLIKAVLYHE
jgi:hypothetical protein